jgi:hypothetical protein
MTRKAEIEYLQILEEEIRRNKKNKLRRMYDAAYGWQRKFIAATNEFSSCMLMAANRCIAGNSPILARQGRDVFEAPLVDILSLPDVSVHYQVDGSLHDTDTFGAYFQGILPTFRLYLSNGQYLDCSGEHRVLDAEGNYLSIRQLMSRLDVLSCLEISEDCLANCDVDDYPCDLQPLPRLDNGQALPPLSGDAQQHSRHHDHPFLQADEVGRIDQYNQAFQSVDLLANQDALNHVLALNDTFSSYVFSPTSQWMTLLLQEYRQYLAEPSAQLQSNGEDDSCKIYDYGEACSNHIFFSQPFPLANKVDIIAWQSIGLQPCFDLIVPDHNNYIAAGIVNHNCGKTRTGLVIDAYHLTGDYPDDWEGIEFDHPPMCWLLGYTGEKTRDLLQNKLFGRFHNGAFEGGLISGDRIIDYRSMTGTSGAMREVRVKHELGVATCQFWSYKQGQDALMGDEIDWWHIDEEPENSEIFPQVLTRALSGGNFGANGKRLGGHGIITATPEHGKTQLVCKFMGEEYEAEDGEQVLEYAESGMYLQNATWDQCEHLDETAKRKILAQYPAYQRKMRSKGIPLLGSGLIFEIDEDDIKFEPSDYRDGYPDHWFIIGGCDFGWDHPASIVQLAWDRDADSFYLVNAWKGRKKQPYEIWHSTKNWMSNVPLAFPHDGYQHRQSSQGEAKELRALYEEAGFNMLDTHSTWEEGGFAVWPAITQIHDLMKDGRFKIANSLIEVFEEIRQYHTKVVGNNKEGAGKTDIVKVKDDLIDGIFKAYMMRRHAVRIMDLYPEQSYQHTQGPTGRDSNTGY